MTHKIPIKIGGIFWDELRHQVVCADTPAEAVLILQALYNHALEQAATVATPNPKIRPEPPGWVAPAIRALKVPEP